MPSWKKVIISGSNAALNTLTVSNGVTGSLFGTASWAVSSSNSQNAQDLLLYVKNVSGAQIDKGKVVRISGATGDNALITTASYENDGLSANTLGIVNQNIPNDSFGYIITEGTFIGFDTSTPGWTAGQLLYLGANGTITGSAPQAPLHAVRLGQVLRVQLNNGSMYVRIDNGYELGELHDVRDTTTTSSFGDLLVKSGSVWTNSRQLTGSYGLTGSLNATSFTGSLFGTSSWAVTASNITPAITNSSDNYLLTDNGDGTINGESNLIFDGTLLGVTGQLRQGDGSAVAAGNYSHAQGDSSEAQGNFSHAEGQQTIASGYASHAEGLQTKAIGEYSHAEGFYTTASGDYSHAEGEYTYARGSNSHAEGRNTRAEGINSHAEGSYTLALGDISHTEGYYTTASGDYSHAEGDSTLASGSYSHAEGYGSIASGSWSHAEGSNTQARGGYSHTEGRDTVTSGGYSHAEGRLSIASGNYSHAEGATVQAIGEYSHAEGANTQAIGGGSHAEGSGSRALGEVSHAEGFGTLASGSWSHAEGLYTTSSGAYSHAEGQLTVASGSFSHAEGEYTEARGDSSHAEGNGTRAMAYASHAEGISTLAQGLNSHAEGRLTTASGDSSHAEGFNTVASGSYQHVQGQFNISSSAQSAFIIGNGTANGSRSNLVFASGSIFQVTGSVLATQGFTGSLFGTSSWAVSASFAISSSRAVTSSFAVTSSNALTASFVTSSNVFGPNGSNSVLSASFAISSSRAVTSSFAISSSNALTASFVLSSSYAVSSSNALTSSFLSSGTNAFIQNGNSFGTTALLGTNDNQSLALETSGSTRMFISSSGNIGIGTTTPTVALQIGDTTSGTGNYIKVLGNNSDSTYDVFVGARRYPRFTLEDTTVGGSAFQMWSLGNTMRFGTNTGTTETSAWYTKAGNAADVIFNGKVGIGTTSPNHKLDVSGSANITGSLNVGISTITTARSASSAAGANAIFTQATGSFTGAKYLYTVTSASNARTGEVMAVWNGTSVQYTDNSTLDIGSTTAVTASVSIVTAQAQFNMQTTNAGWTIKSQVTYL